MLGRMYPPWIGPPGGHLQVAAFATDRHSPLRRSLLGLGLLAGLGLVPGRSAQALVPASPVAADQTLAAWSARFAREVDRRIEVPPAERLRYIALLQQALADAGLARMAAQAFVLVDRSPQVQTAAIVVSTPTEGWYWLGAAAVSTGKTGTYEHFLTPLGAFPHSLANPDFRAEGTLNKNRIRGYGRRGMRVYDFGWQLGERGWGAGNSSRLRLQMHATDPQVLESRLGRVASEGCIRIPATLNLFIDRYGVLDADYDLALARGDKPWVLRADREPVPWPGRYLVIVESDTPERPEWAALPVAKSPPKPAAKR